MRLNKAKTKIMVIASDRKDNDYSGVNNFRYLLKESGKELT